LVSTVKLFIELCVGVSKTPLVLYFSYRTILHGTVPSSYSYCTPCGLSKAPQAYTEHFFFTYLTRPVISKLTYCMGSAYISNTPSHSTVKTITDLIKHRYTTMMIQITKKAFPNTDLPNLLR